MKSNRCSRCERLTHTPYHITEIRPNESASVFDMCEQCGENYLKNLSKTEEILDKKTIHVQTPDKILHFKNGSQIFSQKKSECTKCGMDIEYFKKHKRMGCPECYYFFGDKLDQMLLSIHGSNAHIGKFPQHETSWDQIEDPVTKIRLLKLHYSKALELEEYEKLADLKSRIDQLSNCQ